MARTTYRTRLEALIANSAISQRDRAFAQSLLSYYERKGRVSAGRAEWVAKLEVRYSAENLAAAIQKNGSMLDRLVSLHALTEPSSYANGFVESLINQTKADRRLSDRQIETLKKIESEHDKEALNERRNWVETYKNDPKLRENVLIAAHYYKTTGYFGTTVQSVLTCDTFIPTFGQYNKMVKNKYAQKVLAAHYAPAKYPTGELVTFRASAGFSERQCNGVTLKRDCPMMVVAVNAAPVRSAAKGAKVYKLLPVGKATTIMVEERQIMKARKLTNKK